nr:MAG TPA: hypothetical protein [Caudoviricetes sp.]
MISKVNDPMISFSSDITTLLSIENIPSLASVFVDI